MNRRSFLGMAAAAPLVAGGAVKIAARCGKTDFLAKLSAATEKLLAPMKPQPCTAFWMNAKIVTPLEVRLLYPMTPAALPIAKRKSSRAFWLTNPERDSG